MVFACLLPAATPERSNDLAALRRLPIRFEPAAGGGERIYEARGIDYQMAISPSGGKISLRTPEGERDGISLTVEGANPAAKATPADRLPGGTNFMLGKDTSKWRSNVPGYKRVTYSNVLPAVDLAWYGAAGQLEFDFIVKPGGDPGQIRVKYAGQQKLSLDADGNLVIDTGHTLLTQKAPAVYQKDGEKMRLVTASYELRGGGVVGYHVGAYDRRLPLIIDPVLVYAGYFGGDLTDTIAGVARDSRGRIYLAGTTQSSEIPVTDSGVQGGQRGSSDGFVIVLDPARPADSQVIYATYFGGAGADQVTGIGIDAQSRIFLTGVTQSTDFPMSAFPRQGTGAGGWDTFFTVIDSTQEGGAGLVYSTYMGGAKLDWATAIAVRPDGTAAVVGYTDSTDFPKIGNSQQGSAVGARDAFVAIFDVFQTLSYTTYLGGVRTDYARAAAFAPDGSLFVVGSTVSTDFPVAGAAFHNEYYGGGDAFLSKFDPSGLLVYSTFLGDGGLEEGTAVAAISADRVVVAGVTLSNAYPTVGALASPRRGDTDIFVSALDISKPTSEQLTFSTLVGGSETEVPYSLVIDLAGQAVLTGYTTSLDFPVSADAIQSSNGGGSTDAFVLRLNLTQQGTSAITYSSYIGGAGRDIGFSALREPNGRFVIGGSTSSRRIVPASSSDSPWQPGAGDGFIAIVAP